MYSVDPPDTDCNLSDDGHPLACTCPACDPDAHHPADVLAARFAADGMACAVLSIDGANALLTFSRTADRDIAFGALRGYDVCGDGPVGLRVAPSGWFTRGAVALEVHDAKRVRAPIDHQEARAA